MIPISTASFYGTYRPLQVVSLKILTPLKLNQIRLHILPEMMPEDKK